MRVSKRDRAEAIAYLREHLSPGDTVSCIVRSVARSGMSRDITLHVIRENETRELSYLASRALGWPEGKRGIRVQGCGMDMCFHTVYSLASVIFKDAHAEQGPAPAASRSHCGAHETDRGYWLKSRTL